MTEQEAKLILSASREFDADPDDRTLAAALEHVDASPELRRWYTREQECIRALDAKLGEVAPPSDLRTRILATHQGNHRSARRWSRRRAVLGTAAILLLSLLGGYLWVNRPFEGGGRTAGAYERDMTTFLDRFFLLDYESEKVSDVKEWIADRHGIETFRIPPALSAYPSLGCEVIHWQSRVSFLICFDVEGVVYHLLLLPGGMDLESPAGDRGAHALDPKWATARWNEGNDLYFCCALESQAPFQRVLKGLPAGT